MVVSEQQMNRDDTFSMKQVMWRSCAPLYKVVFELNRVSKEGSQEPSSMYNLNDFYSDPQKGKQGFVFGLVC